MGRDVKFRQPVGSSIFFHFPGIFDRGVKGIRTHWRFLLFSFLFCFFFFSFFVFYLCDSMLRSGARAVNVASPFHSGLFVLLSVFFFSFLLPLYINCFFPVVTLRSVSADGTSNPESLKEAREWTDVLSLPLRLCNSYAFVDHSIFLLYFPLSSFYLLRGLGVSECFWF